MRPPEQRATIYGEMTGVRITYNPAEPGWASVEASPACVNARVGGGKYTKLDWRLCPWSNQ